MNDQIKSGILSFIVFLGLLICVLTMFFTIDLYQNRSKFQEGDCVHLAYVNEFYSDHFYYKIIKVGKKEYLVDKYSDTGHVFSSNSAEDKKRVNDNEKVDRRFCGEK
jgi:hypothetical protein